MARFEDQLKRMKDLMGCSVNEDAKNSNHNIEYHTIGADGKVYGIIRENAKYYIKTTEKGKEDIAESYDYIGGFCNRKDHEYSSYTVAAKQLEMKLMSVNEAVGKHVNVEVLNPDKKEDLVIEATEDMRKQIARQRQIMENAAAILGEDSAIGSKNTGVPEAPKTASSPKEASEPFSETAAAKLDKDLTAKASDSKKQGEPFDENGVATDSDMESDKNPKGGKNDYEDAKFVPDNSVANKKPSGAKAVKVNEECEDWGSCGLPSDDEAGVGHNTNIMGEYNTNDIVGQDDQLTDDEVLDNDEILDAEDTLNDENDDVMSDEEFEELLNSKLSEDVETSDIDDDEMTDVDGDDDDDEEWWNKLAGLYGNTSEAKTNRLINSIVESVTKKILGEAEEDKVSGRGPRGNGVGILSRKWFVTDRQYMPFFKKYQSLVDALRAMKHSDDPEDVNAMFESAESDYLLLKRVIKTLLQGGKLNMKPEEYNSLKQALESGNPEDARTLLLSLDDVWLQIGSVWDDKYAQDADAEFTDKNDEWNQHKVDDLAYSVSDDDDLDSIERRDKEYDMEEGTIKEEATVLHDFGKHPGYRKKPITVPNNGSVNGEPFGKKIGDSAPFDEKVKMITDAVMSQIKNMKKKS